MNFSTQLVVGIGASAGGLSVCRTLLSNIEPDGVTSFIVVMHLDPQQPSHMAMLLQNNTHLTVVEAREASELKADHVYVVSPNTRPIVADGKLRITPIDGRPGPEKVIDSLFTSLGDAHGGDCAGIILSGSGSDGAVGLRRIGIAGGLTLVQDPKEAEHSSMPEAALKKAEPGIVASLSEMPELLADFASTRNRPSPRHPDNQQQAVTHPNTLPLVERLSDAFGVDFRSYKIGTLQRRAHRRMNLHGINSWEDYLQRLRTDDDELAALYQDVLVGVTSFFRDPETWVQLGQELKAMIDGQPEQQRIRAWVVGCASGEEPYSLAIVLDELTGGS